MKKSLLKSLSLLGLSLGITLSVAAQEPKVKSTPREDKYKSDEVKVKVKDDEAKYKSEDLKVKDKPDERKVKANVKPMKKTMYERDETKMGETQVRTTEHIAPVAVETAPQEPTVAPVPVPAVKKTTTHKYAAHKSTTHKPAAHKTTGTKYVVRTKVVRDTVFVPSEPEKVVSTEYLHDTVTVTRVDTVVKLQKVNTYTGYNVPKGNFKKVKLKKEDDGTMRMKTKTDK